jgi:hypothetical protein
MGSMTEAKRPPTPALFAAGILAMALTLAALIALPHDPYVRWQAVRTEAFARLGWIYQRIHYDPTPIDVALIGTSHTMNGVDAARVEQGIAARGYRDARGRCVTVTNLAVPAYGRNLHWLIARELLENRPPRLLVIEIFENETRKAHPYFADIATTRDIFTAPKLINTNYVEDLIRLPWRQLSLAIQSLFPAAFGLQTGFDPAHYDGSNVDNTRVVNVNRTALTPPRDRALSRERLEAAADRARKAKDLSKLGARFADYEYAMPIRYLGNILALAREKHVPVRFLYLTGYGRPKRPVTLPGLGDGYPRYHVDDVLADPTIWYDSQHLNARGAGILSQRLAGLIAPAVATDHGTPGTGGCQFGYPQAPIEHPFRPIRR